MIIETLAGAVENKFLAGETADEIKGFLAEKGFDEAAQAEVLTLALNGLARDEHLENGVQKCQEFMAAFGLQPKEKVPGEDPNRALN
ncbi:MAG: hypothetical protein EBR79_02380 [Proteobacteria bacterium]|nr:hypothetical protein [Pseudomonadota bacterium]